MFKYDIILYSSGSTRGRSVSPKAEIKTTKLLSRESSMPASSLLVKKSMEENNNKTASSLKKSEENREEEKGLAVNKTKSPSQRRPISRERVDKAQEPMN